MKPNKALSDMRRNRGLSQKDLAEFVGVRIDTYYRWERGELKPSLGHLQKLCEKLRATPEEIGYPV